MERKEGKTEEMKELEARNKSLADKMGEIEGVVRSKRMRIAELAKECDSANAGEIRWRKEAQKVGEQLLKVENTLDVANKNIAELNERDKVLCAKVLSAEKLNSDLTDHLEGSRVVKELLEDEMEVQEKAASGLREMLRERESEIEALQSILTDRDEAIEEENERLIATVGSLQNRLGVKILNEPIGGAVQVDAVGAVAQSPTIIHKWESGERPVSVKLTKNTKGYGWEISVKANDTETAMEELRKTEAEVRCEYGNAGE